MKFNTFEYSANVEIGIHMIGVGWWRGCTPLKLCGWINYHKEYYDGYWFSFRLGPFFYCIGPC